MARIKIYNQMGQSKANPNAENISESILKHIDTDKYIEVDNIHESDAILLYGAILQGCIRVPIMPNDSSVIFSQELYDIITKVSKEDSKVPGGTNCPSGPDVNSGAIQGEINAR